MTGDGTARDDTAPAGEALVVSASLAIPRHELAVRATKSGGPGGQHVNTSSTRIELLWNVATSRVLDDASRARLLERLATRLDGQGTLRLVASDSRSQLQNRRAAEERLVALVHAALVPRKKRKATTPSRAAREKRLVEKKRHSERKRDRRGIGDD